MRRWAVTLEGVAGVVIDPGQDFGVGAVGEAPVAHVGLPCFVGEVCFEAGEGTLWSFLGVGGYEAGGVEVALDGGHRWGGVDVVLLEVPADCFRTGVKAGVGELVS